MEKPTRPQEKENPSLHTSQRNPSTTTSSSSSNGNNNTAPSHGNGDTSPSAAAGGGSGGTGGGAGSVLPLTPKTIPRSETNPYPTTFIQADTSSFKQVVQMLTGSSETAAKHAVAARSAPSADPQQQQQQQQPLPLSRNPIPPAKTGPKRPAFKLYERRHNSFKGLKINPLVPGLFNPNTSNSNPNSPIATGFSPRYKPEILSPSILDFPSLVLSPVTPLIHDPFNRPPQPPSSMSAEDRAIAEKGFYLHPSPRATTPRDAEPPRLLPLFPVTSPRLAAFSPAANPSN